MYLNGFEIIVKDDVPYKQEVKRSIKERILNALKVNPFKKTKTVTTCLNHVADGQVIRMDNKLIMNPRTFDAFKKEFKGDLK